MYSVRGIRGGKLELLHTNLTQLEQAESALYMSAWRIPSFDSPELFIVDDSTGRAVALLRTIWADDLGRRGDVHPVSRETEPRVFCQESSRLDPCASGCTPERCALNLRETEAE